MALVVFTIFYCDLLVTIIMVKMAKANYYFDIYFLQLLEPLVQGKIFWPIQDFLFLKAYNDYVSVSMF